MGNAHYLFIAYRKGKELFFEILPPKPGVYGFLDYRMGRGHRPIKVILPHDISGKAIPDNLDSNDILMVYTYAHAIAKRQYI
jgi:hypothetical protein